MDMEILEIMNFRKKTRNARLHPNPLESVGLKVRSAQKAERGHDFLASPVRAWGEKVAAERLPGDRVRAWG